MAECLPTEHRAVGSTCSIANHRRVEDGGPESCTPVIPALGSVGRRIIHLRIVWATQ